MSLCRLDGNADMYGLGIRLGFYLQWLARIVADLLLVCSTCDCNQKAMLTEVEGGRTALQCFVVASFIAIISQVDTGSATVVDLYISLLICFGDYFFFIPTYIWRLASGFNPLLDPTRWLVAAPSASYSFLDQLLVVASAAFQIWFWAWKVPKDVPPDCETFGFLFSKLSMKSLGFRTANIVIQALIMIIALTAIAMPYVLKRGESTDGPGKVPRHKRRRMQTLGILVSACIFSTMVVGIELAVFWNGLRGIYIINSTGQLIPFVIGVLALVRIVYKYIWASKEEADGRAIPFVSSPFAISTLTRKRP
ncbi:hypothetical protein SAMD00023353_0700700 [Rosellinia necatrix]|uniref:Uncharacterized protein n=1 Tax=Rosellinia necatrix TaxID=77044 RepID=A0A1S7ULS1_ROSNE|nr:hypothetical protein SAMD00023353_0700700 [Rosellinia necatrix]